MESIKHIRTSTVQLCLFLLLSHERMDVWGFISMQKNTFLGGHARRLKTPAATIEKISAEIETTSSTRLGYQCSNNYVTELDPLKIETIQQGHNHLPPTLFDGEDVFLSEYQKKKYSDSFLDPSLVEIHPYTTATTAATTSSHAATTTHAGKELLSIFGSDGQNDKHLYPCAAMLQASAPFIASHAGNVAVFHIPGELIEHDDELDSNGKKKKCSCYTADTLLRDIAITWLMGMKIVLVVSCRHKVDNSCARMNHRHECHNSLRIIDEKAMRQIEEDAGYVRFEVERKLKKCISRMHYDPEQAGGNVVGGNSFYSAKSYGIGPNREDFKHAGCVHQVNDDNIYQVLNNDDIVLLTTVSTNSKGDMVNVNGNHLAATVANSLGAYKLIYVANNGSVLRQRTTEMDTTQQNFQKPMQTQQTQIQEIPLSFAKSMLQYHNVYIHDKGGFAAFEQARRTLQPHAVEMLLHLGWAAWALEKGFVSRAHIVNPTKDGALLEELFTGKNGQNTCIYQDIEDECDEEDGCCHFQQEDWEAFFQSPSVVGTTHTPTTAYFSP